MHQGKAADAEGYFRQAIATAPELPDAYLGLGMSELREGKTDDAERALSKALKLDPKIPSAHMFLGIAQLTIAIAKFEKSAASTSGKAPDAPKKPAAVPLNPIDKFLGAPAPEKPRKDGEDNAWRRNKKPSPTPAYVFAALFATLYVIGRILEARLIRNLFKKSLLGS